MVHFGLRENSYEKRRCFFWLLVRVHSVDMSIFLEIEYSQAEFKGFIFEGNFCQVFRRFMANKLWGIKILDGFQENPKKQ